MRFTPRFLAGLLACTLVGQTLRADDLPELGDVASQELSLSAEKKIGQQIMDEIRWREPSYLDDPDIETYLNQLGGRLVAASNDPGLGFYFFMHFFASALYDLIFISFECRGANLI